MTLPTVPPIAERLAAPAWGTVDFISDLHLQAGEPETFAAFQRYLVHTPADALFILGDLFEVWVGDDAALAGPLAEDSFEAACAALLRQASARLDLFFMHGNRDFLVGQPFMDACGATLLADPTVLVFNDRRYLLSHGDALCLDDVAYMAFRAEVRGQPWQQAFLTKPLAERQAVARHLRQQSEARKRSGAVYADVDAPAARQWLRAAQADTLIHGHTHRPAEHALGDGFTRVVLSDWDAAAALPRADALRLTAGGLQRVSTLTPA